MVLRISALDVIPRLGWLCTPTPVTSLPELAARLGLATLSVKRDDLVDKLHGGTKPRKLDYLLACPRYASAASWTSAGATGSGHLVALTAAARELKRPFKANIFWEPISDGVLENLAFTASHADALAFHRSRPAMALRRPSLLLASTSEGHAVIPPGGTTPEAIVGIVRGALELAEQVEAGHIPAPDHLYVAMGTAGTAAGLAVGLGLAGLKTTLHAVGVVERWFATDARLRRLVEGVRALIVSHGVVDAGRLAPAPIVVERGALGRGYGHPTEASLQACAMMRAYDVCLEPVYTGKAFASLMHHAATLRGQHVLFWQTCRRAGRLPEVDGWQARLPGWLREGSGT